MIYKNGDKYIGTWHNDKMSGTGTMKYSNSDIYIGSWDDNKKSCTGTLTLKKKITSIWDLILPKKI